MQIDSIGIDVDFKEHLFTYLKSLPAAFKEEALWAFGGSAKYLRPLVLLAVSESLNRGALPFNAAVAVECSHVASCILDDLPCMDDALKRRGRLPLHKKFGEAAAILVATGLISETYTLVGRQFKTPGTRLILSDEPELIQAHLFDQMAICGGLTGITLGQSIDLFDSCDNFKTIEGMIHLKTAAVFQLSILFGWVFGGGDFRSAEAVSKAGYHLGFALQIADDIEDWEEDLLRGGKFNVIYHLGQKGARDYLKSHLDMFLGILQQYHCRHPLFLEMADHLQK